MKKAWILLILLIIPFITTREETLPVNLEYYNKVTEVKIDFRKTLNHILVYESYYANVKADKGKETYAGISRRFNPDWYGWKYIDQYKKEKGRINRYQRLPELDFWVLDYYLDIWVKEEFYKFKDQDIVNYVFDLRINSNRGGVKLICKTLQKFNYYHTSKKMTTGIIEDINKIDSKLFLKELRKNRIAYYYTLVRRDKSQKQFINHWIKRANYIQTL